MKNIFPLFLLFSFSLLTGCQSQTDQFLTEIDQDIARQQAERDALSGRTDSGSSLSETLLGGDSSTTTVNDNTVQTRWVYTDYDKTAYNDARSAGKQIIFFFHTSSSSIAVALDQSINANPSRIPANVNIFKIDYDTASDLKKQYSVTEPSTIIVFDSNGEIKHQVAGGIYKIDSLLNYL